MIFGRFNAIFIGIFLVIFACSLNVLEALRISEIDRENNNIYFIVTMNNNSRVLSAIFV